MSFCTFVGSMLEQRLKGIVVVGVLWCGIEVSGSGLFCELRCTVPSKSFLVSAADVEPIAKATFDGDRNEFPECASVAVHGCLSVLVV